MLIDRVHVRKVSIQSIVQPRNQKDEQIRSTAITIKNKKKKQSSAV